MDSDLMLVVGMVLCILAIPSLLGAYAEGRAPRVGAILVLIGGVLLVTALSKNPRGYTFAELPDVVVKVISRYMK